VVANGAITCSSSEKIDMAARLFQALKVESQSLRFVVQEATISLAAAYKVNYLPLIGIYFSSVLSVMKNIVIKF
jgi:hypothetical protein